MTNRQRISGVDTAWLRMEHPTNLMMIVGVMMFERKLRLADVKRALKARFLSFPRFRQRAVREAAGAFWEDAVDFDIGQHVRTAALPGKAGKRALEALVSELASTPLDFSRPLWQFHLVTNYAGGSALVARVHHCYADGIALIQVMLSMTHESAAGSLALDPPAHATAQHEAPAVDFWEQLVKPVSNALGGAAQLGKGLLGRGSLQDLARKGAEFAADVANLLTMGADTPTRFKGQLGSRKRAAWADPLPLEEVKAVGKALGCSINDVLLSMAAGAMRDYLVDKGDPVDAIGIRAIVPVNLRPDGDGLGLGNHFGMVFLDLPIDTGHPLERVYEVRRRMKALKGSYQPIITLGLLNAVGYGPQALQEQVTQLLGNNATAVMTNVPGPPRPLYFAGQRIVEQDFWVPQSGGIGMGVSILSYDGRIQFGLITDAGLVPDPHRIVERFGDEFDKLMWITLMRPWGEAPAAAPSASGDNPANIPRRFRNL